MEEQITASQEYVPGMWSDAEGKIWFKALVSFIIVFVMVGWLITCWRTNTFVDFSWTHVILLLGGLGIVVTSNFLNNKG
jgi:hypothetical protein